MDMSDNEIEKLREKLNILIEERASFDEIQKVSQLLDECLVEYYNNRCNKE